MLIYFTTLTNQPKAEQMKDWLPGRFDNPCQRAVSPGVNGLPGYVFARTDKWLGFYKDTQVWHSIGKYPKIVGSEDMIELWVGWVKDIPPTPESLLRADALPGHAVTLAGNEWIIPMVREWTDQSDESGNSLYRVALPRPAKYDPTEKEWIAGDVIQRYRRLYDYAQVIYELYTAKKADDDESVGFDLPDDPIEICVEFLTTNYHIGAVEIGALELIGFNYESLWSILRLTIDDPGIEEIIQKKMASGGV